MANRGKYVVIVEKARGNYSAYSPDIPGCVTTGATVEETIENMKEAIEFHFEGLEEPIPDAHETAVAVVLVDAPHIQGRQLR